MPDETRTGRARLVEYFADPLPRLDAPNGTSVARIAILPFTNATGEAAYEPFSDVGFAPLRGRPGMGKLVEACGARHTRFREPRTLLD